MKKIFKNRAEFMSWYGIKEREMYDTFVKEHSEYDIFDALFEHCDEWGMLTDEELYETAQRDGYDVEQLKRQINNCWGEKII